MTAPKCIVCQKPIKKKMKEIAFYPATGNNRQNGERSESGGVVYLDVRPASREEAQRYTNHSIVRVTNDHEGRVFSMSWWEGEYEDHHFHSERCAATYGRMMAKRVFGDQK